jgi:hypothetical protein
MDYGEAGDNVGLLVRGVTREQINRGLMIAKPGSLTSCSVIEANLYVLSVEEGGRVNPFSSGYRPQLYYKTADTAAEICLPDGVKIAKPGDNITIKAKLNFPLTIVKGARFALREGGKTIAAGVVTNILPDDTVLDFGKPKKVKDVPPASQPAATTDPKAGDKTAAKPAGKADKPAPAGTAKPAAGKTPPAAGKTPPAAGKTPPPAGKTPPPAAGKTTTPPPPAAGKATTPPPPAAGKTTPPPAAGKTPPPPPAAGKTPPKPPASPAKAPTPPPPAAKTAPPKAPPKPSPPKK